MGKESYNLGKLGRDKVTGFEGVITAYAVHLYGCNTYYLTSKVKDNKRDDSANGWYDVGRIEIIGDGIKVSDVQSDKPGGENLPSPTDRM
jgi:hypothetical protein